MLPFLSYCLAAISLATGAAVLDPALYLSPSPPLTGEPAAVEQWSRSLETAVLAPKQDNAVVPDEEGIDAIVEELEVPKARTFWPRQSTNYGVRGMGFHIPLTFSLTGSYGTNTGLSTGVIGSSYASVDDNFNYGKSGLAGSSYGLYRSGLPGTRVYGGSGGTSWTGWGNGKWGHYGKG